MSILTNLYLRIERVRKVHSPQRDQEWAQWNIIARVGASGPTVATTSFTGTYQQACEYAEGWRQRLEGSRSRQASKRAAREAVQA